VCLSSTWSWHNSSKIRSGTVDFLLYCDVVSKSWIIWRPLLCNVHNKKAYFSSNKHISRRYLRNCLDNRHRIVEFLQQRYMLANAELKTKRTFGQGILSPLRALLKGADFDSQEQSEWEPSIQQLAVSFQRKQSDQRHGEIRVVRNKQPGDDFKPGRWSISS
jgi:hypothetical protein